MYSNKILGSESFTMWLAPLTPPHIPSHPLHPLALLVPITPLAPLCHSHLFVPKYPHILCTLMPLCPCTPDTPCTIAPLVPLQSCTLTSLCLTPCAPFDSLALPSHPFTPALAPLMRDARAQWMQGCKGGARGTRPQGVQGCKGTRGARV